jgi:hypothetical protein
MYDAALVSHPVFETLFPQVLHKCSQVAERMSITVRRCAGEPATISEKVDFCSLTVNDAMPVSLCVMRPWSSLFCGCVISMNPSTFVTKFCQAQLAGANPG